MASSDIVSKVSRRIQTQPASRSGCIETSAKLLNCNRGNTDVSANAPVFEEDLWSDNALLEPYPYYEKLRKLGSVVWLAHQQVWAITRYAELKAALLDTEL